MNEIAWSQEDLPQGKNRCPKCNGIHEIDSNRIAPPPRASDPGQRALMAYTEDHLDAETIHLRCPRCGATYTLTHADRSGEQTKEQAELHPSKSLGCNMPGQLSDGEESPSVIHQAELPTPKPKDFVGENYVHSAQERATKLLSKFRRNGRMGPLERALEHTNIIQALAGAIAMGESGDSRCVFPLVTVLRAEEGLVSRFADDPTNRAMTQAFSSVTGNVGLHAAAHMGRAMQYASWLRGQAAIALGKLRDPEAKNALGELRQSGDEYLQWAASQALAELAKPSPPTDLYRRQVVAIREWLKSSLAMSGAFLAIVALAIVWAYMLPPLGAAGVTVLIGAILGLLIYLARSYVLVLRLRQLHLQMKNDGIDYRELLKKD
jgi:PBS lyase HEAT-like repeat